MKKLLWSLGGVTTIAAVATPVTIVFLPKSEKTNAEKYLDSISNIYVKANDFSEIKPIVAKWTTKLNLTEEQTSVWFVPKFFNISNLDEIMKNENEYEMKINMVKNGAELENDLSLDVKMTILEKNDTKIVSKAEKVFPIMYDNEAPIFAIDENAKIAGKTISYNKVESTGSLVFDKTNESQEIKLANITNLISAADNVFEMGQFDIVYTWNIPPFPIDENLTINLNESLDATPLIVTALDALGNDASFTLYISVI